MGGYTQPYLSVRARGRPPSLSHFVLFFFLRKGLSVAPASLELLWRPQTPRFTFLRLPGAGSKGVHYQLLVLLHFLRWVLTELRAERLARASKSLGYAGLHLPRAGIHAAHISYRSDSWHTNLCPLSHCPSIIFKNCKIFFLPD